MTIAINERIKEIRLALNLTMEQFGQHIGLKKSAISLMESGKNKPSTQTIYSICREFNVNQEWLLNGIGEMFIKTDNSIIEALRLEYTLDELDIEVLKIFLSMEEQERKVLINFATQLAEKTRQITQISPAVNTNIQKKKEA